eukprot:g2262.t1
MTSDGSSQRQRLQRRGLGASRTSSRGSDNGTSGGRLRPSTSGGGRRRPPAVSHGGLDAGRVTSSASLSAQSKEGNGRQQMGRYPLRSPNQDESLPHEEEAQRRPPNFAGPSTNDASGLELSRTGECDTAPNRYWPTPGGAKEFLRTFVERNQKRLWAYDPALVGLNHVEAYQHLASKGNFEAVKRTLLEKEDALTKGTGSFLMTDTIERFRGSSARRPTTVESSERRRGLTRRPEPGNAPSTATESDPFQSGSSNADKLRRERARRQDLLVHARTRSNLFFRRKGYEPGDFLKFRAAPSAGDVFGGTKGGGTALSARSAAAAAAAAAESRREVYRHRDGGERVGHAK